MMRGSQKKYHMCDIPVKWPEEEESGPQNDWKIHMGVRINQQKWAPSKLLMRTELEWDETKSELYEVCSALLGYVTFLRS